MGQAQVLERHDRGVRGCLIRHGGGGGGGGGPGDSVTDVRLGTECPGVRTDGVGLFRRVPDERVGEEGREGASDLWRTENDRHVARPRVRKTVPVRPRKRGTLDGLEREGRIRELERRKHGERRRRVQADRSRYDVVRLKEIHLGYPGGVAVKEAKDAVGARNPEEEQRVRMGGRRYPPLRTLGAARELGVRKRHPDELGAGERRREDRVDPHAVDRQYLAVLHALWPETVDL